MWEKKKRASGFVISISVAITISSEDTGVKQGRNEQIYLDRPNVNDVGWRFHGMNIVSAVFFGRITSAVKKQKKMYSIFQNTLDQDICRLVI